MPRVSRAFENPFVGLCFSGRLDGWQIGASPRRCARAAAIWVKGGSYSDKDRLKYFRIVLTLVGVIFLGGNLPADDHLAIRLDLANGLLGLLADDCWYLRALGLFPDSAASKSVFLCLNDILVDG
jgi:hypothetical protein